MVSPLLVINDMSISARLPAVLLVIPFVLLPLSNVLVAVGVGRLGGVGGRSNGAVAACPGATVPVIAEFAADPADAPVMLWFIEPESNADIGEVNIPFTRLALLVLVLLELLL
jgi:hypothetical protein